MANPCRRKELPAPQIVYKPINEISRRIRNILSPPSKLSRILTAVRRIELTRELLMKTIHMLILLAIAVGKRECVADVAFGSKRKETTSGFQTPSPAWQLIYLTYLLVGLIRHIWAFNNQA